MKHTPGPWAVAQNNSEDHLAVVPTYAVDADKMFSPVCIVTPLSSFTETDAANAALIAQAPAMLVAMQEFCARVEAGTIRSKKTYTKFKEIIKLASHD